VGRHAATLRPYTAWVLLSRPWIRESRTEDLRRHRQRRQSAQRSPHTALHLKHHHRLRSRHLPPHARHPQPRTQSRPDRHMLKSFASVPKRRCGGLPRLSARLKTRIPWRQRYPTAGVTSIRGIPKLLGPAHCGGLSRDDIWWPTHCEE